MKIKIKRYGNAAMPVIYPQGDWFDLTVPEDITIQGPVAKTLKRKRKTNLPEEAYREVVFSNALIDFGIAVELPDGYEAHVVPRSSTFRKCGIMLTNSIGIIDNSYCGNNDTWKFGAVAFRDTTITKGTRIAQFRIVLSQKATIWQKIKHLFSGKIQFVEVENLSGKDRGGIGSTGR